MDGGRTFSVGSDVIKGGGSSSVLFAKLLFDNKLNESWQKKLPVS